MKNSNTIRLVTALIFLLTSFDHAVAQENVEKAKSKISQAKKKKRQQLAQLSDSAKAKRKKRKNRRKKKGKQAEASAVEEGKTIHAEHEGQDAPYFLELSLLSDLLRSESTTKSEGGGESKGGSGAYLLSTEALWIMSSSFEIGGTLYFA